MPSLGKLHNKEHTFTLRVFWEDTDASGRVYHANYLKFAERARSAFLTLMGLNQQDLMKTQHIAIVVKECHISYHKGALLLDTLLVRTRLSQLKGATVTLLQTILCGEAPVADLTVKLAFLKKETPCRVPPAIKSFLTTSLTCFFLYLTIL